jgi:hypothetical protein
MCESFVGLRHKIAPPTQLATVSLDSLQITKLHVRNERQLDLTNTELQQVSAIAAANQAILAPGSRKANCAINVM